MNEKWRIGAAGVVLLAGVLVAPAQGQAPAAAKEAAAPVLARVPSGDVKTAHDKRRAAVFPDKPAGLSFDPPQAEAIWLLR